MHMEDNRGGERRRDQETNTSPAVNGKGKGLPREFEGMNFEQQRGSYKNSDRGQGGEPDRPDGARERR